MVRCSRLPLIKLCPASSVKPETVIVETGEAAELGTRVHDLLARHVAGEEVDPGSSDESFLFSMGARMWRQLSAEFPSPLTEVELAHAGLTGHVDVIALVGLEARILDWKSGMKDSDYSEQMRGYMALTLLQYPDVERCTATLVWLRTGEIERYTMTREQATEWMRQLSTLDTSIHNPGSHCQYCQRSHECKAANALVRRDVAGLLDMSLDDAPGALTAMEPDAIVGLLSKAKMVENYASRVKDAIRSYVEQTGLVEGSEKILVLVPEKWRHVDPLKAWPILVAAGFEDAEFAECVTVSASKVDGITSKKAGRGKGAGAVRELQAKLEAVGAVSTTEIKKLTEKRKAS